jgi:hypothetical protein
VSSRRPDRNEQRPGGDDAAHEVELIAVPSADAHPAFPTIALIQSPLSTTSVSSRG